jgi:hypothetical protein
MFITQPRRYTPRALPPLSRASFQERMAVLCRMSRDDRQAAARRGDLTYAEACKWAARFPDEVELVDGEFWFISQHTPETRDTR